MDRNAKKLHLIAAAAAVAIVAGSFVGLNQYSNAKYATAFAGAHAPSTGDTIRLAIEPSSIEVVARPVTRTRTAQEDTIAAPRERS